MAFIPIVVMLAVVASTLPNIVFAIKPTPVAPVFLNPKTIAKYVNQLVVPPVFVPDSGSTYTVNMVTSRQQILPTVQFCLLLEFGMARPMYGATKVTL